MPHLLTPRAVVPKAVGASRRVIELHCAVECDEIQCYKSMVLKSVNNGENVDTAKDNVLKSSVLARSTTYRILAKFRTMGRVLDESKTLIRHNARGIA
jgi:hypothetical protein